MGLFEIIGIFFEENPRGKTQEQQQALENYLARQHRSEQIDLRDSGYDDDSSQDRGDD